MDQRLLSHPRVPVVHRLVHPRVPVAHLLVYPLVAYLLVRPLVPSLPFSSGWSEFNAHR